MAITGTSMESLSLPDHIPELVVEKILRFLPTKLAVQTCFLSKEWQSVASSFRSFDLDERNYFERHGSPPPLDQHEHLHEKFMDFFLGYLAYCKKNSGKEPLDKLSIRLRMYSNCIEDNCSMSKWLKYACRYRRLKELEICADFYIDSSSTVTEYMIKSQRPLESKFYDNLCQIPLTFIAGHGESLTSLKLECGMIMELRRECLLHPPWFSALKILSLKAVRFVNLNAPYTFLSECTSIENLSLEYCSFKNSKWNVSCSSLKHLEVKCCDVDDIRVDQALNLELFSFVSLPFSSCESMILNSAFNLKRINVCVDNKIREFSLSGCHRVLEATIKCKEILQFKFLHGYLTAKFSFKLPLPNVSSKKTKTKNRFSFKADRYDHKLPRVKQSTILVAEFMEKQAGLSSDDPTYIATLVSFLQSFSCCKRVNLYNDDFQSLIITKTYRRMVSTALLPYTSDLEVRIPKRLGPFEGRDRHEELSRNLHWIAPSARVRTALMDYVEEDRHMSSSYREPGSFVRWAEIDWI